MNDTWQSKKKELRELSPGKIIVKGSKKEISTVKVQKFKEGVNIWKDNFERNQLGISLLIKENDERKS